MASLVALEHEVGMSVFLAERYGITRKDYFEAVYTAEDFGLKAEVLERIQRENVESGVLSVGDQLKTDIIPALRLGMKAVLVINPSDSEF